MKSLRTFKVDKLIRDKVPEILEQKGFQTSVRIMENEEYIQRLKNKLVEEAQEAWNADNNQDIIEELADVLEIIHALSSACNISLDEVEKFRTGKRMRNGAFERKIYSEFIRSDSNNSNIDYYLSNPEQYPEVDSEN
jgi:predicted house-cleaning noncanonical NTP pyrophosphatase (MazG superfamily)